MNHFLVAVWYTLKKLFILVLVNGTEIVKNGATDAGQDNKTLSR